MASTCDGCGSAANLAFLRGGISLQRISLSKHPNDRWERACLVVLVPEMNPRPI
jgi:hypothetical protein